MEITVTKTQADYKDVLNEFHNKIYQQLQSVHSAEEIYQLAEAFKAIGVYSGAR